MLQATWLHTAHARATSSFLQMGVSQPGEGSAEAAGAPAPEQLSGGKAHPAPEGASQSADSALADVSQVPPAQQKQQQQHEAGASTPAADAGEEDDDDLDLLSLDNWDDILAGWIGAVGLDIVMAGAGAAPGGPSAPDLAPPEPAAAAHPAAAMPPQQQLHQQLAWSQPQLPQHGGGRPFLSVVPDLVAHTSDTLPLLGHDPAGARTMRDGSLLVFPKITWPGQHHPHMTIS